MNNEYYNIDEISESLEVYESKPNKACVLFVYFVLSVFVIGIVALYFIKIESVVKVQGKLKSVVNETTVYNSSEGAINKINVSEGSSVKKGDVLYTITNEALTNQVSYIQEQLDSINDRKAMINTYIYYLEGSVTDWDVYDGNPYFNEYDSKKKVLESQCENVTEDVKNSYYEAELANLHTDKNLYQEKYNETKAQLDELKHKEKELEVTAPIDGKISFVKNITEEMTVVQSEEILTITPEASKECYVEAYVSDSDVGKITENLSVKFSVNAYDAKEYGYIEGEVNKISDNYTVNEYDGQNYYKVKIVVNKSDLVNTDGKVGTVKSGMNGVAKIVVGKKRLINLFIK